MFEPRQQNRNPAKRSPWNGLTLPSTLHLEAARPGAAAHMSLHQNHNVKERQKPTHRPTPIYRGDLCALLLVTVAPFRVARRCGEGAYMDTPSDRQQPFALLFHIRI